MFHHFLHTEKNIIETSDNASALRFSILFLPSQDLLSFHTVQSISDYLSYSLLVIWYIKRKSNSMDIQNKFTTKMYNFLLHPTNIKCPNKNRSQKKTDIIILFFLEKKKLMEKCETRQRMSTHFFLWILVFYLSLYLPGAVRSGKRFFRHEYSTFIS